MTEAIVVLLLSPLLFLGVAEWRDWQKECERTLHRAKNARENGGVLCRDKRKQMRSFKSNDLRILFVFFCMKNTNSLAKNVGCRSCDELNGF